MPDRLTIKQYWARMLFIAVEVIVISAGLFIVADMQNAELAGASSQSQIIAIISILLMVLNGLVAVIYSLVAILKRARDTGYTIPLFLIGAIVPFGFVIVGAVPSKK